MKTYLYLLLFISCFVIGCSTWNVEPKVAIVVPVVIPPAAAFTVSSTTGTAPCSLTFTNQSTNAVSYFWEFGDGQTSQTSVTSLVHSYTQPGTFTVKLTATGPGSTTSTQQLLTIRSAGLNFTWQKLADFPGNPRSNVSVFVIGTKAYLAGGYLGPEKPTDELWEFDGTTQVWAQKAALPRKGAYATGFANTATATGYITGLYTDTKALPGELMLYNQAKNEWTTRSAPLLNRTFCSVCVLGDIAYIGVGRTNDGSKYTNQAGLLQYNMTTGASATIPATGLGTRLDGRIQPIMLPINGKCLIGGGQLITNDIISTVTSFVEFDPNATTKFNAKPDKLADIINIVSVKGRYFGLTATPTKVYEYKNDNWELAPLAQSNTPPILDGGVGIIIGDAFYLGLGGNSQGVRTKEIWKLTLD